MMAPATYFTCKQSGHLEYWTVVGKAGELRSSFPNKDIAKLHCAQLNAAFAIGQVELLKEQFNGERGVQS